MSLEDTPRSDPPAARTTQVAALTGLRGFAALMVVLMHTSVLTAYPWLGLPEYGPVSLFVLSGYLLFRPWSRWGLRTGPRPSIRTFARRRLLRIFPAYLVVLVVVAIVLPDSRPDGAGGWLRAATFTWIYEGEELRAALFQTWSLATEMSWYVVLPVVGTVLAVLASRMSLTRGFWLSAALISLSLPVTAAWRWWDGEFGEAFVHDFWLPGYLVCFAAGALVAHLVEGRRAGVVPLRRLSGTAQDPWALAVVAGAAAVVGTSSLAGPDGLQVTSFVEHQVRFVSATVMALVLLVAVVLGSPDGPLPRVLSTPGFAALGRWSYGIYLWHLPVIVFLQDDVDFPQGVGGLVWRLVVVLGISVPLGAATYVWVERPMIALSRRDPRRSAQDRPAGAAPQPAWRARLRRTTPVSATVPSAESQRSTPTPTPSDSRSPGE